jgi:hypothetical protein
MRLRAVFPNGLFDEALVVQSPSPDWLVSLLGGHFDNKSLGILKPFWRAILLHIHATTSERPGALVSSWYTAPWLRWSIYFKLKPGGDSIPATWYSSPSVSADTVDGAHLELRSNSELCRNDKLVAAHHLCAIFLAYVEKEPASFGAALNLERYHQCRSSKRTRSEPSMTDAPASKHHRRKATQTLPVAQYAGTVESGRLPLTPAA